MRSVSRRSGCDAIAWHGERLASRCFTEDELRKDVLALRHEVLHKELGWTVAQVRTPEDLCDLHDRWSVPYGVTDGARAVVAAARLILTPKVEALPSIRLLQGRYPVTSLPEPTAEVSRIVVRQEFRRCGLFRVLLLSGVQFASAAGIRGLLITERDEPRWTRTMAESRFVRIADGFSFVDETIAPREPAATYLLDLQADIDDAALAKMAADRHALLQGAEARLPTCGG